MAIIDRKLTTTIVVKRTTHALLCAIREYPNQPLNDVILKLAETYNDQRK